MKKIMFVLVLLIAILFTGLFIISNNKVIEYDYFTILEAKSYVYKEGRRIDFNVYCNKNDSLISYPEKNSYSLELDDILIQLTNVSVTKGSIENYYLVKIEADMPDITDNEFICNNPNLIIKNSKYEVKLKLGSFSVLKPKGHKLLSVQALSASFSIVNNIKHLVGINLKLTNTYDTIDYFRLGGYSFGMLSKIKYSKIYDDEIEISDVINGYSIKYVETQITKTMDDNILFVPIGYKKLYLQRGGYIIISLNNSMYYLDSFNFMLDIPSPNNYKDLIYKGEIIYDKSK